MSSDILYRILDETCILRTCLHAGPVALLETDLKYDARVTVEEETKVPHGTIEAFLKTLSQNYGAYGYAAVDNDMVVGQVRFYPSALVDMWTTERGAHLNACIQEDDQVRAMSLAKLDTMPQKVALSPRSLTLACFQVVNDYKAMAEGKPTLQPSYLRKGIGTTLLQKVIAWARANDWEEIRALAIAHIPPLMAWSAHLSVERYRTLGFEITPSPETVEVPVSQRRGYHGEVMKRMWEPYSHLSDEEVSRLYDVVLRIKD